MNGADWWLSDRTGARCRVRSGGVLIGRSPDCDIVVMQPDVSRHQALVYCEGSGAKLVPLGAAPCTVDGVAAEAASELLDGSIVGVGELELTVHAEVRPEGASVWLVQLQGGGIYSVGTQRFTIGGSATDDLRVEGLAGGAVVLIPARDFLAVEALTQGVKVANRVLEPNDVGTARVGDFVKIGAVVLRVFPADIGAAATVRRLPRDELGARRAELSFLPRGGRLDLDVFDRSATVYLAERRCDLIACLLRPPDPFAPGEFVDDESLIPRVWPNQVRARTDLNTLLHRVRKTLVAAGIDGAGLIERANGGGATRFVLLAGAMVKVK